ncbi:hypothetical protein ACJMK2_009333 [Sinanodonta woodiana]|uniref:Uncharacterized protein n=1 Tax=Sinanodonta woodiana TaxID=1069815 RepID=A0ABD3VBX2_SINWO
MNCAARTSGIGEMQSSLTSVGVDIIGAFIERLHTAGLYSTGVTGVCCLVDGFTMGAGDDEMELFCNGLSLTLMMFAVSCGIRWLAIRLIKQLVIVVIPLALLGWMYTEDIRDVHVDFPGQVSFLG